MSSYDTLGEFIGITEVYAVQAWCRAVAKGKFRVEFSDTAPTASIYRDRITFPRPNAKMTRRDAIKMRGFMVHETSHPMYQPDYNDVVDKFKVDMRKPFGMVWNILLDCHAESCRARGWPGDAKALSEFGTVTGMTLAEKLVPQLTSPETLEKGLDPNFDKLSVVMIAHVGVEGTWNAGMRVSFEPVIEAFGPDRKAKADELIKLFDLERRLLDQTETAESLLYLAQDVYKHLWGDEQPEDDNVSGNGKPKGGEEGDSQPSGGEGEGESDSSEKKDGNKPRKTGGVLIMESLLFTDHYKRDNGDGNPDNDGGEGEHLDFTNYRMSSVYEPCDPARIEVINYEG